MSKKLVIIDTDPGVDDAIALLNTLLNPKLKIIAISSVYGNHFVEQTTANVLRTVKFVKENLHIDCNPLVIHGSSHPLNKHGFTPYLKIHGKDGLGDCRLPFADKNCEYNVVSAYLNAVKSHPGEVSILCLGPLTNLAKFVLKHKSYCKEFKEIVIMGGTLSHPGNFNSSVEANLGLDPQAAKIVFSAPFKKITLVPLDVTEKFLLTNKIIEKFRNPKIREFYYRISKKYNRYYQNVRKMDAGAVHDLVALYVLMTKKSIKGDYTRLQVVVKGADAGKIQVRIKQASAELINNIFIVNAIDQNAFWNYFRN